MFRNYPACVIVLNIDSLQVEYKNYCILKELGYSEELGDSGDCSFETIISKISDVHKNELEKLFFNDESRTTYISLKDSLGNSILYHITSHIIEEYPHHRIVKLKSTRSAEKVWSQNFATERDISSFLVSQSDGIGIVDSDETFVYANKVASTIFGLKNESLEGRNLKEFLSDESFEFIKIETLGRKKGDVSMYELPIIRPDGKPCYIQVTATPHLDSKGNFVDTIGIFKDITDKKRAEENAKYEQEKLKSIVHSLQDMIFIIDGEGRFVEAVDSDFVEKYAQNEDFVGKKVEEVLPEEFSKVFYKYFEKLKKTNEPQSFDYSLIINKKKRWYTSQILNIKGSYFYGEIYVAIVSDITNRKKQESKIKKSSQQLKEINEEKDKLISIISHDLKNPLGAIIGMSEMLNNFYDKLSEEKRKDYIEKILLGAKSFQTLLDNSLMWSLNEQKRIGFQTDEIEVSSFIEQILISYKVMFDQKSLNVRNFVAEGVVIKADENMLRNIFSNLITNSYKFSHNTGNIDIVYNQDKTHHIFSVIDYGVGMEASVLKNLFKSKKSKIHKKGSKGESGTGLGLLLCKEFVRKHKGEIKAQSEPGVKTEFVFTISKSL
jgi:PAS domain S-box-containing protein